VLLADCFLPSAESQLQHVLLAHAMNLILVLCGRCCCLCCVHTACAARRAPRRASREPRPARRVSPDAFPTRTACSTACCKFSPLVCCPVRCSVLSESAANSVRVVHCLCCAAITVFVSPVLCTAATPGHISRNWDRRCAWSAKLAPLSARTRATVQIDFPPRVCPLVHVFLSALRR
jgi:hypothetical protein